MSVVMVLMIGVVIALASFLAGLTLGGKIANERANQIISGQRRQIADLIEQIDYLSHQGTNGRNGR